MCNVHNGKGASSRVLWSESSVIIGLTYVGQFNRAFECSQNTTHVVPSLDPSSSASTSTWVISWSLEGYNGFSVAYV